MNCLSIGTSGESLRVHVCADDIDVVFDAAPDEIHMVVLEQIGTKALTLGLHPGQGQTSGDVHASLSHPVLPQLLPDTGERQDVVIRVADLVRGELPVSAANDVVFAVVNQQVLCVDGLVVEGQDAGGEDAAGGFQVAVAIVNSDDLHVLKLFHNVPLFQFFRVKVMLLIWNSIVWVSLACSRLETLFGSQSVLKRRLLPGKVLARGTRG